MTGKERGESKSQEHVAGSLCLDRGCGGRRDENGAGERGTGGNEGQQTHNKFREQTKSLLSLSKPKQQRQSQKGAK